MFNGVSDQLHQFIASSRTAPPILPSSLTNSLPLHVSPLISFSGFEPYPSLQIFQSHLLHQLHQSSTHKDEEKEEQERAFGGSLELQGMTSQTLDPWTNEEELALLRIRSSMNSGFSDIIWEHISRKLAELGFKRSGETCREKFEELNKYCNTSYSKNLRSFSELESLYQGENPKTLAEKMVQSRGVGEKLGLNLEEDSGYENLENPYMGKKQVSKRRKKRKTNHKLVLFKGYCEEIVNKILFQQEELYNKLLEDVNRREEERVAKEEAWKKQEMARLDQKIETKAHEQAIAWNRESGFIEILKKFTSDADLLKIPNNPNPPSSPSIALAQIPNSASAANSQNNPIIPISSTAGLVPQNPDSTITQTNPNLPTSTSLPLTLQNPNSLTTQNNPIAPTSSSTLLGPQNPNSLIIQNNPIVPTSSSTILAPPNPSFTTSNNGEDHGKRWPRDEVNSLISLRSRLYGSVDDKEGTKVPLWERISQGMLELGYKRSAKRCKEKWENINKYFRKTKDANKKRTPDSKTCPYFHQLKSLYNQGTLIYPSEEPENQSNSLVNRSESGETTFGSSQGGNVNVEEGDKTCRFKYPAYIDFEC